MRYNFKTQGVCAKEIEFDIENDKIYNVKFEGGCMGNLQGISKLATGKHIDEVISALHGIKCRNNTSCPDQLAKALIE